MEWHVSIGTQRYIARSLQELQGWLLEGRVPPMALVYHPSIGRWTPAIDVPQLREAVFTPSTNSAVIPVVVLGSVGVAIVFVVIVVLLSSFPSPSAEQRAPEPKLETTSVDRSGDYDAGFSRGKSEGADHARSGAGMPIPLGMNWMADSYLRAAHPSDAEAWKNGFKSGFEEGYKSVRAFDRAPLQWEQLSPRNARAGVKLFNYDGKHEATIQRVDGDSGLIVVRYRSGNVEPKMLSAVAPYWWVRKK